MARFFLASLAFCIAIWGTAVAAEPRIFTHDGLDRTLWLDDGRIDTSAPAPLVIALHGYRRPSEADALREDPSRLAWPDLQTLGAHHGFVTLYPAAFAASGPSSTGSAMHSTKTARPLMTKGSFCPSSTNSLLTASLIRPQSTSPASPMARS